MSKVNYTQKCFANDYAVQSVIWIKPMPKVVVQKSTLCYHGFKQSGKLICGWTTVKVQQSLNDSNNQAVNAQSVNAKNKVQMQSTQWKCSQSRTALIGSKMHQSSVLCKVSIEKSVWVLFTKVLQWSVLDEDPPPKFWDTKSRVERLDLQSEQSARHASTWKSLNGLNGRLFMPGQSA